MAVLYPDLAPAIPGTIEPVGVAGQRLLELGIVIVGLVILWRAVRYALFGKKKK